MSQRPIEQTWGVIEDYLRSHFPSVFVSLAPPASETALLALERTLGFSLPADFRASLARHNGQLDADSGLVNGQRLLNTEEIAQRWRMHNEIAEDGSVWVHPANDTSDAIATDHFWHRRWVPFTEGASGWHHVLDLAPRARGSQGQVFFHALSGIGEVIAPSFSAWLELLATRLVGEQFWDESTREFNEPWFTDL